MNNATNTSKTIRRNAHKKIAKIFASVTECTAYTLDNCFSGTDADVAIVEKQYRTFNFAKLVQTSPNTYRIRMHSNCWFEMVTR